MPLPPGKRKIEAFTKILLSYILKKSFLNIKSNSILKNPLTVENLINDPKSENSPLLLIHVTETV